jgi:hypothetical protein
MLVAGWNSATTREVGRFDARQHCFVATGTAHAAVRGLLPNDRRVRGSFEPKSN